MSDYSQDFKASEVLGTSLLEVRTESNYSSLSHGGCLIFYVRKSGPTTSVLACDYRSLALYAQPQHYCSASNMRM
jgi:hypothetical protein